MDNESVFGNEDDSDDSASDDNLKAADLYSQVYMEKKTSIKDKMRRTNRAHKNFIQEVKIKIKSPDQT